MSRRPPRVVACVLTYNNEHDTAECLAGIARLSPPCDAVVLVDNGSTDGSGERLRAAHPDVTTVRIPRNAGYTGGTNRALAEALAHDPDYVLFMCNDTVPEPPMLAALLEAAEQHADAGLLGPRVMEYDAPERLQHGAGYLSARTGATRVDDPDTATECDWLTGCGYLVRAEALRAMKPFPGFDERFFLYWEDVDFSRRIADAGYRLLYVPPARLRHKESDRTRATMSHAKRRSRQYYMIRNRFLFGQRHLGRAARTITALRTLLMELPRQIAGCVVREGRAGWGAATVLLRGYVDGLRGREGRAEYPGLY